MDWYLTFSPPAGELIFAFWFYFNFMSEEKKKAIRFGLNAIKNVGNNLVEAIVSEREKNGKFKSIEDFISRVGHKDLNKKSLESLIKSGALDCLGKKEELIENVDLLLEYKKNHQKKKNNKQTNLFGLLGEEHSKIKFKKPENSVSEKKKLDWEKEFLGIYLSNHPFKAHEENLKNNHSTLDCKDVFSTKNSKIKIAGIISGIKKIITKTKENMLFVNLEDLTGKAEILVFPSVLKRTIDLWKENQMVIIDGHLSDKKRGEVKILCDDVKAIS